MKILLAEDNLVIQAYIKTILKEKGFEVKTADNGKQVLQFLDSEKFDIIIMDIQMPILNGIETTLEIRKKEKKTNSFVPILALTAYTCEEDKNYFLSIGMNGHISKPINEEQLFDCINATINK